MRAVAFVLVGLGALFIFLAVYLGSSESGGGETVRAAELGGPVGFLNPPADLIEEEARPAAGSAPAEAPDGTGGAGEHSSAGDGAGSLPVPEAADEGPIAPPPNYEQEDEPPPPIDEPAASLPALAEEGPPVTAGEAPGFRWGPSDALPVGSSPELDLAAAMAHGDNEALKSVLTDDEAAISASRRDLAQAFLAAVWGQPDASDGLSAGLDGAEDVVQAELDWVRAARHGESIRGRRSSAGIPSPLARAMRMTLLEREGEDLLQRRDQAAAAQCFSELLLAEVSAPWPPDRARLADWDANLSAAQQGHRWSRKGEWPSVTTTVREGDTLSLVRKRVLGQHPELLICTGLIDRANQLGGRYIHPGQELRIPTDQAWALVHLEARRVLYLHGDEVVATWEVGIGKEGHETEVGEFVVGLKEEEPPWWRPGQPPVPFGDPENPLGTRWIEWYQDGAKTSLGFHGTSDPGGVGRRVSLGCIRMHNAEVEELFEVLPLGARVSVRP